jgi:hypothetical protein
LKNGGGKWTIDETKKFRKQKVAAGSHPKLRRNKKA